MCSTHLVETTSELRRTNENLLCAECREPIFVGDEYRHVEGSLDDGSPGLLRYRAHEECHVAAVQDYDPETGCFTYAGVEEVPDASS